MHSSKSSTTIRACTHIKVHTACKWSAIMSSTSYFDLHLKCTGPKKSHMCRLKKGSNVCPTHHAHTQKHQAEFLKLKLSKLHHLHHILKFNNDSDQKAKQKYHPVLTNYCNCVYSCAWLTRHSAKFIECRCQYQC